MMRFDLTDLQLFSHVVEAGTITGGAEASHITLASASERIRGMEDALGSRLFVRSKKGVTLTAAGEAVLHHARLVVAQMERMRGELRDLGAGFRGHVRLHCNTSALAEHIPSVLGSFLRAHPDLSVDMEERSSHAIADGLRERSCDVGVLSDASDLTGLDSFRFRSDPLVVIVPTGHRLSGSEQVQIRDVLTEPFVGLAEGSALQSLVTAHARRSGGRIHYRVRLLSLESVCRLVSEGIGVAVVPLAFARHGRADGVVPLSLDEIWAQRTLVVCVRKRSELPSHAAKLVAHLLESAEPPPCALGRLVSLRS